MMKRRRERREAREKERKYSAGEILSTKVSLNAIIRALS
jgi:hypothetical protein